MLGYGVEQFQLDFKDGHLEAILNCPVGFDLFNNAVQVGDGQSTLEDSEIQKCYASKKEDPLTRQAIKKNNFRQNLWLNRITAAVRGAQEDGGKTEKELVFVSSHLFLCSQTGRVITNPVLAPNGEVYDLSAFAILESRDEFKKRDLKKTPKIYHLITNPDGNKIYLKDCYRTQLVEDLLEYVVDHLPSADKAVFIAKLNEMAQRLPAQIAAQLAAQIWRSSFWNRNFKPILGVLGALSVILLTGIALTAIALPLVFSLPVAASLLTTSIAVLGFRWHHKWKRSKWEKR